MSGMMQLTALAHKDGLLCTFRSTQQHSTFSYCSHRLTYVYITITSNLMTCRQTMNHAKHIYTPSGKTVQFMLQDVAHVVTRKF